MSKQSSNFAGNQDNDIVIQFSQTFSRNLCMVELPPHPGFVGDQGTEVPGGLMPPLTDRASPLRAPANESGNGEAPSSPTWTRTTLLDGVDLQPLKARVFCLVGHGRRACVTRGGARFRPVS